MSKIPNYPFKFVDHQSKAKLFIDEKQATYRKRSHTVWGYPAGTNEMFLFGFFQLFLFIVYCLGRWFQIMKINKINNSWIDFYFIAYIYKTVIGPHES